MGFENVPRQQNPEENPVNWESLRVELKEKIRIAKAATGEELSETELDDYAGRWTNFSQYFKFDRRGTEREHRAWFEAKLVNGFKQKASPEENEQVTLKERLLEWNESVDEASEEDFFTKHSEKFLTTPVAQFFRDIDNALSLANISEEELREGTWRTGSGNKSSEEQSREKISRAYSYLVSQGYNYSDLCA